jgi:hypothetical protein
MLTAVGNTERLSEIVAVGGGAVLMCIFDRCREKSTHTGGGYLMFARMLTLSLCLGLLVPACRPEEQTGPSVAASEPQKKAPAADGSAPTASTPPSELSQAEESSLSARAEQPGPEVSGGALSNLHLTYAVIALAAIVLVLLIK